MDVHVYDYYTIVFTFLSSRASPGGRASAPHFFCTFVSHVWLNLAKISLFDTFLSRRVKGIVTPLCGATVAVSYFFPPYPMADTDNRGFADMDPEKRSEIAAKGGSASPGNFKNDPERAAEAGRKGGQK
jgi:uncharacterized protein